MPGPCEVKAAPAHNKQVALAAAQPSAVAHCFIRDDAMTISRFGRRRRIRMTAYAGFVQLKMLIGATEPDGARRILSAAQLLSPGSRRFLQSSICVATMRLTSNRLHRAGVRNRGLNGGHHERDEDSGACRGRRMPRSRCSSRTRPRAVADQSRRCRDSQGRFQAHHRGALAPSSRVASLAPQAPSALVIGRAFKLAMKPSRSAMRACFDWRRPKPATA